jgi:hypothetical protein
VRIILPRQTFTLKIRALVPFLGLNAKNDHNK